MIDGLRTVLRPVMADLAVSPAAGRAQNGGTKQVFYGVLALRTSNVIDVKTKISYHTMVSNVAIGAFTFFPSPLLG